jgi:predicted AAA+ superfamily ATPase
LWNSIEPRRIGATEDRLHALENLALRWGGMPALSGLDDTRKWDWLKSYEQTYLERDLGDLVRLNDLTPFRTFQKLAALRAAGLLSYTQLARDSQVSVHTARRYVEYLKLSYQAFLLPPFGTNQTSTAVKTPKLYWVDLGVWRVLSGLREGMTGQAFENYVVSEIEKLVRTLGLQVELSFYRTRSGMEVDLLCRTQKGLIGIEIKSSSSVSGADCRSLRAFASSAAGQWLGGIVVYRGNEIKRLSDSIWAVPSTRLLS